MRTVYAFNEEKYFTNIVSQNIDELKSKEMGYDVYPDLFQATLIPTPTFDGNLTIPKFVNNEWILEDLTTDGEYYKKSNGEFFAEIKKKERDDYTIISITLNEGDVVHFDDVLQAWIYDSKGSITIARELEQAKKNKKNDILNTLNSIKCFIDKDGVRTQLKITSAVKDIFVNGKNYLPFYYYMVDNNYQKMILDNTNCDNVINVLSYLIQYIRSSILENTIQIDNLQSIDEVNNYKEVDRDGNALIQEKIIYLFSQI